MPLNIGHITDLAAMPGMPTDATIYAFIASRPDFPLIRRGASGRPHIVDLDAAHAFMLEHWRDKRKRDPKADRQMKLGIEGE